MDNLEIENLSLILDPIQSGEMLVLLTEFKLSINDYLQELVSSPVRTLAEIIEFNTNHPDLVSIYYIVHSFFSLFGRTCKFLGLMVENRS